VCVTSLLRAEEALGERGDETDLDQQPKHRFQRRQPRQRIARLERRGEEDFWFDRTDELSYTASYRQSLCRDASG